MAVLALVGLVALACFQQEASAQVGSGQLSPPSAAALIAAALTDAELMRLNAAAHQRSLDVLCEVHNGEELDRVVDLGADAIGVNNRDLRSFAVTLETSLKLVERVPSSVVRVSESGIHTAADLALLRGAGFDAFLVGESLMRQPEPGAALAELLRCG